MFENLVLLYAANPPIVLAMVFVFGALIGSFLNVVIYRLPVMLERDWQTQARLILEEPSANKEEKSSAGGEPANEKFNLIVPNSRCPGCERPIKPWENIPIISYLLLRGKCKGCRISISARYPTIEFIAGLLSVVVIQSFGFSIAGFALCGFTYALLALAMIDYDTQLLPDDITLPLLWSGLIVNYFGLVTTFSNAFWGAVIGYLSLWSVYQGFRLLTGKEGMGFGDFKLLAALGAWLGWQILPLVIIVSSLAGAVIGGLLIWRGREKTNPIPFGPFLAIAGWVSLVWGEEIITNYIRHMT